MYQRCSPGDIVEGKDVVTDTRREVGGGHTEHIAWPLPSSPGLVVGPLAAVCQRRGGALQRGSRV